VFLNGKRIVGLDDIEWRSQINTPYTECTLRLLDVDIYNQTGLPPKEEQANVARDGIRRWVLLG
jgi:hypothetical protein